MSNIVLLICQIAFRIFWYCMIGIALHINWVNYKDYLNINIVKIIRDNNWNMVQWYLNTFEIFKANLSLNLAHAQFKNISMWVVKAPKIRRINARVAVWIITPFHPNFERFGFILISFFERVNFDLNLCVMLLVCRCV